MDAHGISRNADGFSCRAGDSPLWDCDPAGRYPAFDSSRARAGASGRRAPLYANSAGKLSGADETVEGVFLVVVGAHLFYRVAVPILEGSSTAAGSPVSLLVISAASDGPYLRCASEGIGRGLVADPKQLPDSGDHAVDFLDQEHVSSIFRSRRSTASPSCWRK